VRISKCYFIVFLVTTLAGVGLHYLYDWLPSLPTAALGVVRESLWEHVKLLFWPYLFSSLLLSRRGAYPLRPRLLTLLLMCAALLFVSFWYHILLGGESVALDITLYFDLMLAGFVLPFFISGSYTDRGWNIVFPLTAVLALLLILFTFFPPDHVLFLDLSGANTWSKITC